MVTKRKSTYRCLCGCRAAVGKRQMWDYGHTPTWVLRLRGVDPSTCVHSWLSGLLIMAHDAPQLYRRFKDSVPDGYVVEFCRICSSVHYISLTSTQAQGIVITSRGGRGIKRGEGSSVSLTYGYALGLMVSTFVAAVLMALKGHWPLAAIFALSSFMAFLVWRDVRTWD